MRQLNIRPSRRPYHLIDNLSPWLASWLPGVATEKPGFNLCEYLGYVLGNDRGLDVINTHAFAQLQLRYEGRKADSRTVVTRH